MKKDFFSQDYTQGQLNAFVKMLAEQSGYEDVVERTLCKELTFSVIGKPWTEKNPRIYFEVSTLGLTAEEWKERLIQGGHKLSDWTKDILSKPDYNQNHRYEAGKMLKVVLIRGKDIEKDSERLTKNLKVIAVKDFGEKSASELKGELALLIREKFNNKELEKMGLWYIAVLHEPIVDSGGDPFVLYSFRGDGESWVGTAWDDPGDGWNVDGAFAFLQD
ncbi:MAG: hypothetical protein RI945_204 [Candidatus Parcubacteria bacterium]